MDGDTDERSDNLEENMEWRVSAPKPTPPAITRRWRCEFRGIPAPRSMRHTVGDGSPHAVEPIHQFAVVVIPVPKVEDEQNNQRGHEYAHLTSLLPAAQVRQPPGRPASVCRSSVCRSCHCRFYSGLVVGSSCAWPPSIGNGVAVRPRKDRPGCALRGVQTGSVAGLRGLSMQPRKGCAVHAQPGFPTPRRKETIRRSVRNSAWRATFPVSVCASTQDKK